MGKLTFYIKSSPEKLDRIGDYLGQIISHDLYRNRFGYVNIAMEGMDIILESCVSQNLNLNLFVESYLKIIQVLLETSDPLMQLLATQSFTKFAEIEEDTPSYHRRYDFFVSKFSSLCHDSNADLDIKCMLRIAGLNGLRGVIRKTVSDDLQLDIWNDQHMEKIVPSLLFNMQENDLKTIKVFIDSGAPVPPDYHGPTATAATVSTSRIQNIKEISPSDVAEENLRELVGRAASSGTIGPAVRPVLNHFDHHNLWLGSDNNGDFAISVFSSIMASIQEKNPQYSHHVIQILMSHLDEKSVSSVKHHHHHHHRNNGYSDPDADSTKVRTGIAIVLSHIVKHGTSEAVGPIVLDIVNSLLNQLRSSITTNRQILHHQASSSMNSSDADGEKEFQRTAINTLGEFANNLPDYQKISIMIFILRKIPISSPSGGPSSGGSGNAASNLNHNDSEFRSKLLESVWVVATKYRTTNMNDALPADFLQPLLNLAVVKDRDVRKTVQRIFHQLLDRHDFIPKVSKPVAENRIEGITVHPAYQKDLMFMRNHGIEIISNIYENIQLVNNDGDNYCSLYTTIALIYLEMSSNEATFKSMDGDLGSGRRALIEILRLTFYMQEFAITRGTIGDGQKKKDASPEISSNRLSEPHKAAIHSLVAGILRLLADLNQDQMPEFSSHVNQVIEKRAEKFQTMLPEYNRYFNNIPGRRVSLMASQELDADLFFDKTNIMNSLRSLKFVTSDMIERMDQPFMTRTVGKYLYANACSWSTDTLATVDSGLSHSLSDQLNGSHPEVDSVSSSPGMQRVSLNIRSQQRINDSFVTEIRRRDQLWVHQTDPQSAG